MPYSVTQVHRPVAKDGGKRIVGNPEDSGIINQHGLNRKVRLVVRF